ncbi:MAG: DNA repair protein RadA [Candidatus Falkowbacteria bacterium]
MADKQQTIYVCTKCDAQFPKWSGRCLECGAWGTLAESVSTKDEKPTMREKMTRATGPAANFINLADVESVQGERILTGMPEVDRVLGGGLVPGSLVLLGGEPGIGKSTITAQIVDSIAKKNGKPVLYVSGEESAVQVKSRLERLNCDLKNLSFAGETNIEKIIAGAIKLKPQLVVIDSIQTVHSSQVPSEAGNINQIRACAVGFLELAKTHNIAVLLIGHITKDGQIAGPKSLEHIVDTVVYLEAETINNHSLLRAAKNRFGSINEIGVFEMTGAGFREVSDPSSIFLENGQPNMVGTAIGCVLEGSRAFLIDVQALVTKTIFGYPQRKASGFDLNRLQVLAAVLSKKQKLNLGESDIILNIVGGLKINDPALDLAVALAIISSLQNKELDRRCLILGELGLSGELRPVSKIELRLSEAEKLGFTTALIPDVKNENLNKFKKIKLLKVKNISEAISQIF